MCGIFACVQRESRLHAEDIFAATMLIRHRGPDDEGYVLIRDDGQADSYGGQDTPAETYTASLSYTPSGHWKTSTHPFRIALGHRRLSILDLSVAGHQPMCDLQQSAWITYNGEIYNYVELRTELEADGFQFQSNTDTEVVLAAYKKWGEACVDRFNGMWAFVIVDLRRRRLFAAVDRFAIKPLYIWSSPAGDMFFASELKQFTKLPEWEAKLHESACYEFLAKGRFNHVRQTLLQSVLRLRGGEKCSVSIASLPDVEPNIDSWYELPAHSDDAAMTDREAIERFRELFTDSIRLRLRADVKVGSCLSGGLDSSSIVCIANDMLRQQGVEGQQETISSCYEDPRFDERDYIRRVVDSLGVKSHNVFPTVESLLESASSMAWQLDGPFFSGSVFSQWNVFAAARKHGLIVMLDGQGADEQLGGYHKYFQPLFTELLRNLKWIQYARQVLGWSWRHASAVEGIAMTKRLVLSHGALRSFRFPSGKDKISSAEPPIFRCPNDGVADELMLPTTPRTLNDLLRNEINRTSLPRLLHYEDRNSMAHSVEARVPFLDYRLVEFLVNQPIERKIRCGETKFLLREAMRGVLPEEVRTRQDKMGFVSPEAVWMRGPNAGAFRDALSSACRQSERFVDELPMLDHFDKYVAGKAGFSKAFWRAISFGNWMHEFGVSI